jgi:RecA-family ATPase
MGYDANDRLMEKGPEALLRHFDQAKVRNGQANSKPPKSTWSDHVMSASALQTMKFDAIKYIVPGLIPEGLTLLVGRPKIGKSWLALDGALAVASESGTCLGLPIVEHGAVLYCALEDNARRLQKRITKLIGATKQKWPERLTLTTQWQRLDKGGVKDIEEWAKTKSDARLVILDTLASVRPVRDRDGYKEDYAALAELHRLANDMGIAALVLHHQRKAEADDPLDTISGTLGLAGCTDTALVLQGTPNGMTLYVRGRDVEEAEHAVSFDKQACRWTVQGIAADVHRGDTRKKILGALSKVKPNTMKPSEIAGATGLNTELVYQTCGRMLADGEIMKHSRGEYAHP